MQFENRVINMSKIIDGIENCYNILKELSPTDLVKKCLVSFLFEDNSFVVKVLNEEYKVSPYTIYNIKNPADKINYDLKLAILYYLTQFKSIGLVNELINYRSLKGGDNFFTGAHTVNDKILLEKYGSSKDAFLKAGERLGGEKTSYGDASFKLNIFPLVPIYYILWLGDDELKPNISILFDKTIEEQFPLDIIHALIKITTDKLIQISVAV